MKILLFLAAVLFFAACDTEEPLTSDEAEIVACFGEDFPTVPASGAAGRGFTPEQMTVAVFGADPLQVPDAQDRADEQLRLRSKVFAGIGDEMFGELEKHLEVLGSIFAGSATSSEVPSRFRLFKDRGLKTLDHSYVYYELPNDGKPVVERVSREKLSISFNDWNSWGTIAYAASPATLDLLEDLLLDKNPSFSGELNDTVVGTFDVINRQNSAPLRYTGEISVDLRLKRLTLEIDERTSDRTINMGGTVVWNFKQLKLQTLERLSYNELVPGSGITEADWDAREVLETGSLGGGITTAFDIDLSVEQDNDVFRSSAVTELRSGLLAITFANLRWGLGEAEFLVNGELALTVEGTSIAEANEQTGYENDGTNVKGSGALRDLSISTSNEAGEIRMTTSGRLRVGYEESSENDGDLDKIREEGEGVLTRKRSGNTTVEMPCGVGILEFTPTGGEKEIATIRFHGDFSQNDKSDRRDEAYGNGAFSNSHRSDSVMRFDHVVFRTSLAGAKAQGRMPAYVQESHRQFGESRQPDGMLSGGFLEYFEAETSETRIAKSGYIGFDGLPAVFSTQKPLRISRVYDQPCCSADESNLEVDASGLFTFVAGDVWRQTLDTEDKKVVREHTVNDQVIEAPEALSPY